MTIGLSMVSALDWAEISFVHRGSEAPCAPSRALSRDRKRGSRPGTPMAIQDKGGPRLLSAVVAVNIAALIFGATALFGRIEASPAWIVAGRGFFACLTLFAVAATRGTPLQLPARRFGRVALSALLLALHWIAFFTAVR